MKALIPIFFAGALAFPASAATQAVTIDSTTGAVLNTPVVVFASAKITLNGNAITSGTVAEAYIASTIARDSEVAASISALNAVYQPLDADLTDLSDGSLTGSKVGTGINAANVTVNKLPVAPVSGAASIFAQPVLRIEIPRNSGFTDFELKATVNNFTSLIYYYVSGDPTKAAIPAQIWSTQPKVWFTDSSSTDPRRWRLQNSTQSIYSQLATPANGYVGNIMVAPQGLPLATFYWNNPNLVWSYVLLNPGGYEKDASNRPVWREALPEWLPQTPTP